MYMYDTYKTCLIHVHVNQSFICNNERTNQSINQSINVIRNMMLHLLTTLIKRYCDHENYHVKHLCDHEEITHHREEIDKK